MNLNTSELVTVEITNLLGQTVYSKNLGKQAGRIRHKVNIKAQPAGIYFVKIIAGTNAAVVKIIKN